MQAERPPDYQYGDRLRISGQLQTPPSFADFSYADYLARQGVHSVIWRAGVTPMAAGQGNPLLARLYRFKGRALRTLETLFPQPHAALLQGILLGVESGIPRALKDDFSATEPVGSVPVTGAGRFAPAKMPENKGFRAP